MTLDKQYDNIFDILYKHFRSASTVDLWLVTENPMLGGVSPHEMLLCGRHKKLMKFIKNSLNENKRGN